MIKQAATATALKRSMLDVREVLQSFMVGMGGPEAVGRELKRDIEALQPGDSNRIRLLTAILSALGTYGGDAEEPEDLDELKAQYARLQRELDSSNDPAGDGLAGAGGAGPAGD